MKKRNDIMIFMCGMLFAAACCLSGFRLASARSAESAADCIITETNHDGGADPDILDDWEILQMAMMKTESGFDPTAVGTSDDRGVLQITPIYVREVNRLLGEDRYTHDDAFSVSKSIEMFNIMQSKKNPRNDMARAVSWISEENQGQYRVHQKGGDRTRGNHQGERKQYIGEEKEKRQRSGRTAGGAGGACHEM